MTNDKVAAPFHGGTQPPTEPRTWRYRTWGASTAHVVASTIEFTPGHVVWRDSEGRIVHAEDIANVGRLSEVGHLGSATRHIEGKSS